jgi:hypothetical protein
MKRGRKGLLFLKKKKQKDFYPIRPGAAAHQSQWIKVLWFFLSRKNKSFF